MPNVLKQFRRIKTSDQDLDRVQQALEQILNPIARVAQLNGTLVTVQLKIGDNKFAHGLGNVPQGWFITDINAASSIYRSKWDQTYLTLNSSAVCTANVWIF